MIEELTRTEAATQPPTRWHNWWEVLRTCGQDGKRFDEGSWLKSEEAYPSKELAEQAAIDTLPQMSVGLLSRYLGAWPEGEMPPE